ncbi:recombinase family protein [Neobacillus sp. CF12]|uniref:recombinase family protein n=1 Tax=Neobacillus sp. CF12 TaxID=3055864 RepID=UPI0025A2EF86|nr:recombinase family protein [Neobacillus sp. CF12]MDM5326818.1 recombinase family protein [Neobacillus sp. CF12]
MGQKVGYIRVSSKEQNLDRQLEIIMQQGVEKIFREKKSGKNTERPEFKSMMEYVREGDTLIIESYSRLARSTKDLLDIVDELEKKGVNLISVKEKTDTTTPTGKLLFTIMAGIAQFEREIMLQRQAEGIKEAMKQGKTFGRPRIQLPENFEKIHASWRAGHITAVQAMKDTKLTRATFYRLVKEYEAQEELQA